MALLTKKKWKIASAGFVRLEDATWKNMVISTLVKDNAADTVAFKMTPADIRNGVSRIYGFETIRSGDLHPPKGMSSSIDVNPNMFEISFSL